MSNDGDGSDPVNDFDSLISMREQGRDSQLGAFLELYRGYLFKIAVENLAQNVSVKIAPSDLVQETLINASQAFDQFHGATEAEWRGWLRQILKREIFNAHRRFRDADKRNITREVSFDEVRVELDRTIDISAAGLSPSTLMIAEENSQALQIALGRLSDEHQRVIQMRTFDQLCFEEIGKKLGRSTDAARKLFARAVSNLSAELKVNDSKSI